MTTPDRELPEPDLLVECAQGFVSGWTRSALDDLLRKHRTMRAALERIEGMTSATPGLTDVELGKVLAAIGKCARAEIGRNMK